MNRWWRAYDEAVDDPKLIRLTDEQFRFWFNILCVCSTFGGSLPEISVVAIKLRMQERKAKRLIDELREIGLLDHDNELITPHNWSERQYKSDVSTERVKRFRNGKRNVSAASAETFHETPRSVSVSSSLSFLEDSLGSKEDSEEKASGRKKPKTAYPEDFDPSWKVPNEFHWGSDRFDYESKRFRDYCLAHDKRYSNWQAAWGNWCRSPYQLMGNSNAETDRDRGKSEFRQALKELERFGEGGTRGEDGGSLVQFLPSARRGE